MTQAPLSEEELDELERRIAWRDQTPAWSVRVSGQELRRLIAAARIAAARIEQEGEIWRGNGPCAYCGTPYGEPHYPSCDRPSVYRKAPHPEQEREDVQTPLAMADNSRTDMPQVRSGKSGVAADGLGVSQVRSGVAPQEGDETCRHGKPLHQDCYACDETGGERQRCFECDLNTFEPGYGCHNCGYLAGEIDLSKPSPAPASEVKEEYNEGQADE